jgi:hypothetical protein
VRTQLRGYCLHFSRLLIRDFRMKSLVNVSVPQRSVSLSSRGTTNSIIAQMKPAGGHTADRAYSTADRLIV